jgi:hypothetical protein
VELNDILSYVVEPKYNTILVLSLSFKSSSNDELAFKSFNELITASYIIFL